MVSVHAGRSWLLILGGLGPMGSLPASGTLTVALLGLPLFWATRDVPIPVYIAVTVAFIFAAVGVHHVGDRLLGEKDSQKLVWDELAGFALAVTAVPFTWQTAVLALLVERAIDIVKVPPAGWIERSWPGGWGVVGDDVVAGLYTCAILHLAVGGFPGVLGVTG
jgi:phosphatidylglycerophosphatase A